MSRYPHVSSPLRIGRLELRNRIVRSAHVTGLVRDGIGEPLIAYHEARARGGVGLLILEIASVHPSSFSQGHELITAYRDDVIAQYQRIATRVHAAGAALFEQLWHGGAYGLAADGGPSWSASEIPGVRYGAAPIEMTQTMIDEVVAGFAAAARRCRDGGIDGIELHAGHGYLLAQFLSPVTNRRHDGYGGSPENRRRLLMETLVAVRDAVGPDYPFGVRISSTDLTPGGPEEPEMRDHARALVAGALVDFVDVSIATQRAPGKFIGAMHEPHGYELPHSERVTRGLRVPTIVTGRITTLAEAEAVVASGIADLVSMVRATIADPDLVVKSLAGDESHVRPCIGCNQSCVGGIFGAGGTVGCAVNADAGRESVVEPLERASSVRTVLVVGAGPAGLEAARVAARRGHHVMVREAARGPGGLTAVARLAPHRREFGDICDWLAEECTHLGVDLAYDTPVDRAVVAALAPDTVVVATGSTFRRDGLQRWRPALEIPGLDLDHVVTPVEVLTGTATGRAALVVDDLGSYPAVGVSEYLVRAEATVTFATSFPMFAPELVPSMQAEPALARLHRAGTQILTRMVLTGVEPTCAHLQHLDSGVGQSVACDLVVLVTGFEARRSLYDELTAVHPEVHLVGDARSPRGLPAAIAEANALARTL